jgi:hypothetical protein
MKKRVDNRRVEMGVAAFLNHLHGLFVRQAPPIQRPCPDSVIDVHQREHPAGDRNIGAA